jgi:hypothetical protein
MSTRVPAAIALLMQFALTLAAYTTLDLANPEPASADNRPPPSPAPPPRPRVAGRSQYYFSILKGWWASDGCHYYSAGSRTYGDLCTMGIVDDAGKRVPKRSRYRLYDPNAPQHRGELVADIYAGNRGWAMYRDWTDPRLQNFPTVKWILHPLNDGQVNADNFYAVMDKPLRFPDGRIAGHPRKVSDGVSNKAAYSVGEINALVTQLQTPATATPAPVSRRPGVPAWDPTLLPITKSLRDQIYNAQRATYTTPDATVGTLPAVGAGL